MGHNESMDVSVVATVYNEADSIERLLDSLAAQTRAPDEVVICDGGSTDGTPDRIRRWATTPQGEALNLTLLIEPHANISRGRNRAIAAARGSVVAVTDAGVRLHASWLAELVKPWEHRGDNRQDPIASAGFFLPDVGGVFTAAMAATVLPLPDDIAPDRFLPSSRSVAFTKAAWAAAGGYPEWLDYCEDLIFDLRINALRPERPSAFTWSPAATVYFRPRQSLLAFWRQYYRYGRGDGKADLWRTRHAIRYATYLVLLPALLGYGLFGATARWAGWLALAVGVAAYCRRPWARLRIVGRDLPAVAWIGAAMLVPVIRVVGDLAKMAGYPAGLWWRWQRRRRPELHWRDEMEQLHGAVDRRP
jgi:glycosyltransferase involved in cell wall biosynthesis